MDWHTLPKERDPESPFGRAVYIPVPGFDRSFLKKDLDTIAGVTGGRRLISCQDRHLLRQSLASMVEQPRAISLSKVSRDERVV